MSLPHPLPPGKALLTNYDEEGGIVF